MIFDFANVSFNAADFAGCRFAKPVTFKNAAFTTNNKRVLDYTSFSGCVFMEDATFDGATFETDVVTFADAEFHGRAVSFVSARFTNAVDKLLFERARFHPTINLLSFERADFQAGHTSFDRVAIQCITTNFEYIEFAGWKVTFNGALFAGDDIGFAYSMFAADVVQFDGVTFRNASGAWFTGAQFVGPFVSFRGPRAWENVKFDWDSNYALMPTAVKPEQHDWPPTVQT